MPWQGTQVTADCQVQPVLTPALSSQHVSSGPGPGSVSISVTWEGSQHMVRSAVLSPCIDSTGVPSGLLSPGTGMDVPWPLQYNRNVRLE